MSLTRQPLQQPAPSTLPGSGTLPAEDLFEQEYGNAAMTELLPSTSGGEGTLGNPGQPPVADILSLREEDRDPGRGEDFQLDQESVRALQGRLAELEYDVPVTGTMDATTIEALRLFQVEHADEIAVVVEDSRQEPYNISSATYSDGRSVAGRTIQGMNRGTVDPITRDAEGNVTGASGQIRANDATHQVLASTWRGAGGTEGRRRINGQLMTEQETFTYLTGEMERSGLPFEDGMANVLGTRGLQGGDNHDNEGVFTEQNTFNDTFFLLDRDQDGRSRVQIFRGTVDPGGSGDTGFQVEAGQQWDYRLPSLGHGPKYNRPMLSPRMRRGREGSVLDPERGPDRQRSVRETVHDGSQRTMGVNFAMHSGGDGGASGDISNADSTGCQVVHGAWYGHYIESLRRAMDTDASDGRTPRRGDIRYTLLDADEMQAPGAPTDR